MELGLVDNPIKVETLSFSDLKSPSHLARNPMGTSPTFVDADKGIRIWESGAVLTYLLDEYDISYKMHPQPRVASALDRANFWHVQQFITATVYPFVSSLYLHCTLRPESERDPSYIATATHTWNTKLAPTLVTFVQKPFFLGNTLTAIDLLVAKPLNNAHALGILEEFPELLALFQTVRNLPSFSVAYGISLEDSSCEGCRSLVLVPAAGQATKQD